MTQITRVTDSDLDDLLPLIEAYRAFYKQDPSERSPAFVSQRIANNEAVAFIARLDGKAVGFTLLYPTFSTVSLSAIWLLNDLFVDSSVRGKGIASALMNTAEAAAKEAGATRVFLRTAHDNTPAQALYEARGWKQDETFRRYDLIF
ncbi:MAG: GNAT family N-acetyltransferase [Actinomycetes bacterium]